MFFIKSERIIPKNTDETVQIFSLSLEYDIRSILMKYSKKIVIKSVRVKCDGSQIAYIDFPILLYTTLFRDKIFENDDIVIMPLNICQSYREDYNNGISAQEATCNFLNVLKERFKEIEISVETCEKTEENVELFVNYIIPHPLHHLPSSEVS